MSGLFFPFLGEVGKLLVKVNPADFPPMRPLPFAVRARLHIRLEAIMELSCDGPPQDKKPRPCRHFVRNEGPQIARWPYIFTSAFLNLVLSPLFW
jgi:hypothetical protein